MFRSLHEFLDYHAASHGGKLFASDAEQSLNYRQARERAYKIAVRMHRQGLERGDRVAILAKNSLDYLLLYLACSRIGVVPTGLNYRLTPEEWRGIIGDAEVKHLFIDEEFAQQLGDLESISQVCIFGKIEGLPTLMEWLQEDETGELPADESAPEDVLMQMYTSGTTGLPKGALLSHRGVISNTFQGPLASGHYTSGDECMLLVAPVYHAAGLLSAFTALTHGGSLVIHRDYDPQGLVEALAQPHITMVTVVPVMLQFSIAVVPNIREYDFSHLRQISYGASPMAAEVLRECMDIFGCDFAQYYGQTECSAVLTCLTAEDHKSALEEGSQLLRSCGRPVFGTELRIVDGEGNDLPVGESGEILARGPQLMNGYWHREEATRETLAGGWLHTGDIGRLDQHGYLYILDRLKDMIISGAENVYPAEVENTLLAHPDIADGAVIGISDERWGEVPMAILVAAERELTLEELQEYCRDHLAGYKIPKSLLYVEDMPRNPTGKILKKVLREQYSN